MEERKNEQTRRAFFSKTVPAAIGVLGVSGLLAQACKPGILGLVVLGLILTGGVYALLVQIIEGHIVTGMRDNVVWGIYIMSAIIIPLAILVHSVLAWIFGMTLRPGWHSTIFAPYFVIAAVFSGTGVLIIAMWVFRKVYHLESFITKIHFNYLGIILMILGAFCHCRAGTLGKKISR